MQAAIGHAAHRGDCNSDHHNVLRTSLTRNFRRTTDLFKRQNRFVLRERVQKISMVVVGFHTIRRWFCLA